MEQNTVIFNVFITRKQRNKRMEQKYFSLQFSAEANEHELIRAHVRDKYPGWTLGGYAPLKEKQPELN